MIRLIVSDLDDTLLKNDRTISPYTVSVLNRLREKGARFTFATGRMFTSARPFVRQLQLTEPVIAYNGALVCSPEGETLENYPVPYGLAKEILQFAESENIYAQTYDGDFFYCQKWGPESDIYYRQTALPPAETGIPLSQFLSGPATKVVLITDVPRVQRLLPVLRERYRGVLQFTTSKPNYLEALSPQAGKGEALAVVMRRLGLQKNEVLAFGDGQNDVSLLQTAGIGMAVRNAHPDAKAAARYVCPSNEEEGVAWALQKLLLEGIPLEDLP